MKISSLLIAPVLSVAFLVSPVKAEEQAESPVPPELQGFVSEVLKITTNMLAKEAQKPETKEALAELFKPDAAKDGQTADLQSMLGSLLKLLPSSEVKAKQEPAPDLQTQLLDFLKTLTQIVADAAPGGERAANNGPVEAEAGSEAKITPSAGGGVKASTKVEGASGLKGGGLSTSSLNGGAGDTSPHTDDGWRKIFPQKEDRR